MNSRSFAVTSCRTPAHAYRARKTLGTFAYAMRRPLFDTFPALTERLDLPADVAMTRLQDDPTSNCFVCHPALVIADVRQSDIRAPRDPRRHSARVGWRLDDYCSTKTLMLFR